MNCYYNLICYAGSESKAAFVVKLQGSEEEAKELVVTPDTVDDDSESEKEPDPEQEVSLRRRLSKKLSMTKPSKDDLKKKITQKHPMWVEWIVHSNRGNSILIQFFYLIKLQIITVKAKVYEDPSNIQQ